MAVGVHLDSPLSRRIGGSVRSDAALTVIGYAKPLRVAITVSGEGVPLQNDRDALADPDAERNESVAGAPTLQFPHGRQREPRT